MKNKAKFVIEIEYDNPHGGMTPENVNIIECESEGDYMGLTLALTSGLAFAQTKGANPKKTFKQKLRLLRATGSALINALHALHNEKAFEGQDIDKNTIETLSAGVKHTVDLVCYGIAIVLGIDNKTVDKANDEYNEDPEENNNPKDKQDGKRDEQRGTESDDINDYL